MASKLLRVLLVCGLAVAADESSVQWWTGSRSLVPCQLPGWERLQQRSPLPIDAGDDTATRVYSWRHAGEEINAKRITSNGSLEIYRKKSGAEGQYQCSVRHSSGVVLGYPVLVKQAYIEKQFTSHPENRTVTAGQPVVFSCMISSAPEANITWTKNGTSLLKVERFHMLKNQLLILDVQPEDAGFYRCTARNHIANKSRTSYLGQLIVQVTSPEELQVDFLPLHHEEITLVPRGGGAKLACPVIGWPRPELTWKMTPPGGRQGELEFTGEVLSLSRAELDQEGVYTCSPSTDLGLVKTFNITISEPVTILSGPKSRPVQRAGTARFNCEAAGRPAPTVTWYKDGELLALTGRRKLLKSATDERIDLVISSVTSEDAGIYQCFASNQVSTASAWGSLEVGGGAGRAPGAPACAALSARRVELRWAHAHPARVVAYTLHTQPADHDGKSYPGQPHQNTEEIVTLDRPLTPYGFQVRAYLPQANSEKNVASDMSEMVVCQGQGVPIKLRKDKNDTILVSWKEFADQNPGVVQWILQHKVEEEALEKNITLPSDTRNYSLPLSESKFIRLLGSRTEKWLPQNLTLVPWTSSDDSNANLDDGTQCHIKDIEATQVSSTWASFKWQCDNKVSGRITYIVCVSRRDDKDNCQESEKPSTTFADLAPGSEYAFWVQARGGPFSQPLIFATMPDKSDHFKELSYSVVNATSVLVSWSGPEIEYNVLYSSVLLLPVDDWTSFTGFGNSFLLSELAENKDTYVIVTDLATAHNSKVLTIPKRTPEKDLTDISYEFVENGILISWEAECGFVVRYTQDLAMPLDQWTEVPANTTSLYLRNLDPKLKTYVMVHKPGGSDKSKVLTVPPQPSNKDKGYTMYHVLAACIFVVIVLCALGAFCLWKRATRRTTREDNAEMKEMTTLSNGGAGRGAGEPLLNGHLMQDGLPQIVPKTPNGKMKRNRQYEAAFDVSRSEDLDTTLQTVVEADITLDSRRADTSNMTATSNLSNSKATLPNLLDTSRKPEFEITGDFAKLPDDNMNSELNRSVNISKKVNSKTPTLQPNG